MNWRFAVLILPLLGCDSLTVNLPEPPAESPIPEIGSRFDAANCGSVEGRIVWLHDPDHSPTVRRPLDNVRSETVRNPNFPIIDPETRGVRDVIVMLDAVDPAKSKPWDHPRASVELNTFGIVVRQGDRLSRCGFVKLGDPVTFRNTTESLQGVRGRNASHFAHVLSPPVPTVERILTQIGTVKLSSTTGLFWASAELIVCDSPYITRTDEKGRYRFDDVPAGTYDVLAWHPSYELERLEIDPNHSLPVRGEYGSPVGQKGAVDVRPGVTTVHPGLTITIQ